MATGLKDNEELQDDEQRKPLFDGDTPQSVYDDEFEKIVARAREDNDDEATDTDSQKNGNKQLSEDELRDAEESGKTTDGKADKSESSKLGLGDEGSDDSLYKPDDEGKRKLRYNFMNRRRGVLATIVIALAASAFGISGVVQGPLALIHFAKLLQGFHFTNNEEFMDGRGARVIRHLVRGTPAQGRLGYTANRYANRWESRMNRDLGIRSVYSSPPSQRFIGYEVFDENKARGILDDLEKDGINTRAISDGVDIDGNPVRGSRFIDLNINDRTGRLRRSVTRTVMRGIDANKVTSALGSRLLIRRGGVDFHPFKNIVRQEGEDFIQWVRRVRTERAERRMDGVDPPDVNRPQASNDPDGDGNTDNNGDGTPDVDPDADRAARETGDIIDEVDDIVTPDNPDANKLLKSLRSRIIKGAGAVTAITGILCTVKGMEGQVKNLQYTNHVLPLMRIGMERITMGNQVMASVSSGEPIVSIEEMGVAYNEMYDEDASLSWVADRSIQAELGQPLTGPDIPTELKPAENTDDLLIFRVVNSIPGLGTVCGIDNFIGGLPIIKQASNLSGSIIEGALSRFGISIQELTTSLLNMVAGEGSPLLRYGEGAVLGGMANYGARLGARDQAIAMGGRELSGTETAALDAVSRERLQDELEQKSFFARFIDPYEFNSLSSRAILAMPRTPSGAVASLFKMPSSFFGAFNMKVNAQTTTQYDYGFSEYGFSLEEQNDPRFENPYENAEWINQDVGGVSRLATLNDRYGNCFSMRIDPQTGALVNGNAVRFEQSQQAVCRDGSEDLLRYRFYLADMVAEHSLVCYEGEEASCNQLMGVAASSSTNTTGVLGISPDGFVFPIRASRSVITGNQPAWCSTNQSNCHHDYNAADIFVPTGTPVVASRGGRVVRAADNDNSAVGSRVAIQGDDGNLYYYAHMGDGTIQVQEGQTIQAGTEIGAVGTSADASGTPPHLHFDILPSNYTSRPTCSDADCARLPFINPQPALIQAFNNLP